MKVGGEGAVDRHAGGSSYKARVLAAKAERALAAQGPKDEPLSVGQEILVRAPLPPPLPPRTPRDPGSSFDKVPPRVPRAVAPATPPHRTAPHRLLPAPPLAQAGLRREFWIIWSSNSPVHLLFKAMQLVALGGIVSFFVPVSPMFLPDAFATGTATLCRNADPDWQRVGLERLGKFLAWLPSERYLVRMGEGGIVSSLVRIAAGGHPALAPEATALLEQLAGVAGGGGVRVLLAGGAAEEIEQRAAEGAFLVDDDRHDRMVALARRLREAQEALGLGVASA